MGVGSDEIVERACRWIRRNPGAWERLRAVCRRLNLEGYLVQRDNVYTVAAELGIEIREAAEYRRDHNLWSVLSRYMAMLDPAMCSCVSFRRSGVDEVDLVGAYERTVGEADFVASSLAEAQAMHRAGLR